MQMIGSRKITPREDVADGAVRRLPHLLEVELLHPGFIRGDGGALDADADLLDRFGGVDGDLIVGVVAVFHPQVEIHQLDIQERGDQLVLDVLPDDPGHLVAIEFDDGIGYLDFCHDRGSLLGTALLARHGNIRRLLAPPRGGRKPRDYALLAHPASPDGGRGAARRRGPA
ncbi:hypothetical protein ACVMGE_001089 [Bradyrhizobium diazoefficiens]